MLKKCLPWLREAWEKAAGPADKIVPARGPFGLRVPRPKTFREDLKAAGIEAVDAEGRHADFHSFRDFFCTLLAKKLPVQHVRMLMLHKYISKKLIVSMQLGLSDLGEEVWAIPPLL